MFVCYTAATYMSSKEFFFKYVLEQAGAHETSELKVLELGCGTAGYVPAMITSYPNLTYVGVEPIEQSFKGAEKMLEGVPRTELVHQLGYDSVPGLQEAAFDVVISFSVLEHVKQLERFIAMGAKYLKTGGLMVHRYDLGHALYPGSVKERFHVWLGNTVPAVLPERKFVRYVPQTEVADLYQKHIGAEPYDYTYHQMPNHKALEKELRQQSLSTESLEEVYAWEFRYADTIEKLSLPVREHLFPTVAVWGRKAV